MWLLFIRARLTAPDSTRFNEGNWEVLPNGGFLVTFFFPSSSLHSIHGGRGIIIIIITRIAVDYSLTFRIFFSTVENMSA